MGLAAALEQERAARMAASGEVAAAEAAARAAAAERDARARDLHAVRSALHETSEKLAAAAAERDMHLARVSCIHTNIKCDVDIWYLSMLPTGLTMCIRKAKVFRMLKKFHTS